ncbi:hypothetical protein CHU98_g3880 [Xylaria longipes]|nr:hypothetical protein CHU98_g3880 [Xylaria longipes]
MPPSDQYLPTWISVGPFYSLRKNGFSVSARYLPNPHLGETDPHVQQETQVVPGSTWLPELPETEHVRHAGTGKPGGNRDGISESSRSGPVMSSSSACLGTLGEKRGRMWLPRTRGGDPGFSMQNAI